VEEDKLNPVTKVRLIVNMMTDDVRLQNSLLSCITHELTGEQINKLFDEIIINNKQLKLDFKNGTIL
jgi:hypothetical protein